MNENFFAETAVAEQKPVVAKERRRPGRVNYTQPALIDLLRAPPPSASVDKGVNGTDEQLAPARGIVFGIMLAVPLWCALGAAAWLVLRWLS
jgi:hypothetical protein